VTSNPIEKSLELVSERCPDLTALVYARLFAEHPQMEALFWRDTTNAIKGEMLAKVFEVILDFIGDNFYAEHMIQCEVVTHAGYDVPPDIFRVFFGTVADTIREKLDSDWTQEIDLAWKKLLGDLDFFATHPDQNQTARASAR
jgi:hemoglobin-like flavoprotein